MKKLYAVLLAAPLTFATVLPTAAQYDQRQYDQRQYERQQYDRNQHREFYNGAYQGGRNGNYGYDRHRRYNNGYDQRYYSNGYGNQRYDNGDYGHRGGIGPGKGAAIGGAGGAVLGLLFGGGLKGALIGGAAGAGIGAIAGEAHKNHTRDQYRRDEYGRPY